jgi:hypothetical protein
VLWVSPQRQGTEGSRGQWPKTLWYDRDGLDRENRSASYSPAPVLANKVLLEHGPDLLLLLVAMSESSSLDGGHRAAKPGIYSLALALALSCATLQLSQ